MDPDPDPTPFFSDFKDAKNHFFHILSSVFKAKRGRNGSKKPKTHIINVS
jgi:hypothetical protein